MKGIILAGGSGTRLFPITKGVSKQLLPVYDKPMIYYSLSVLMLAGIREILIISTPNDIDSYRNLLGDGSYIGINIKYEIQSSPNGIAEAFIIGENFINNEKVALILGDNIFYGQGFTPMLKSASELDKGAIIFGYKVKDANQFGVIDFDKNMNIISIEEKPKNPKSNYVATGLYFYDEKVVSMAKQINPSSRGELEITSLNKMYLSKNEIAVKILGRGFAWLDTGTHDSLLEAGSFVQTLEKRQGIKIACLEEIAYKNDWISHNDLIKKGKEMSNTSYGQYILSLEC